MSDNPIYRDSYEVRVDTAADLAEADAVEAGR